MYESLDFPVFIKDYLSTITATLTISTTRYTDTTELNRSFVLSEFYHTLQIWLIFYLHELMQSLQKS